MMMRLVITAIAILFVLTAAHADRLYKWIDSSGNVSYHNQPPPEGSGYTYEEKNVSDEDDTDSGTSANYGIKQPVKLYTVKKCDACDLVRMYLQKRNVPFTEIDVEKDVKKQRELKKYAGSVSVPTTVIGEKVVTGYNQASLDKELEDGGYPKTAGK